MNNSARIASAIYYYVQLFLLPFFPFSFFFGIYARKRAKGNCDSLTLVEGVELKYEKVKSIEVKVVGLGFMGFDEVCLLPAL